MFHLSFSNRFEILLDTLLERLGAEQPGPFGQREVVVPSSALRRRSMLTKSAARSATGFPRSPRSALATASRSRSLTS